MGSKVAHHGGSNGDERHLAKVRGVDDADGTLVRREYVGEGGVDSDWINRVELAAHMRDRLESPAHWEVESVVVLETPE